MQITLEKSNLAPAEIEYMAFTSETQRFYLPAFSFVEVHGTGAHLTLFMYDYLLILG